MICSKKFKSPLVHLSQRVRSSFLVTKDHYKHKKPKIKQLMMKNHKKGIVIVMKIIKEDIKNTRNPEKFKTPTSNHKKQNLRNKNNNTRQSKNR